MSEAWRDPYRASVVCKEIASWYKTTAYSCERCKDALKKNLLLLISKTLHTIIPSFSMSRV